MCFEGNQAAAAAAAAAAASSSRSTAAADSDDAVQESKFKFGSQQQFHSHFSVQNCRSPCFPLHFSKIFLAVEWAPPPEALDPLITQKHTDIQFVPRHSRSSKSPCQRVFCSSSSGGAARAKGEHFQSSHPAASAKLPLKRNAQSAAAGSAFCSCLRYRQRDNHSVQQGSVCLLQVSAYQLCLP